MAKNTPLSSADQRLQEYLPKDVSMGQATWLHKQSGMKIILHKYLKQIGGLQQISAVPEKSKVDYYPERNKATAFVVVENKDGKTFVSVAEADPSNNKNNYPIMMAWKRALDRAILEALNLQGFFYSDTEVLLTDDEVEEAQRRSDEALEKERQNLNKSSDKAKEMIKQLEQPEKERPTANGRAAEEMSYVHRTIERIKEAQSYDAFISNKEFIKNEDEFKRLTKADRQLIAVSAKAKEDELMRMQAV